LASTAKFPYICRPHRGVEQLVARRAHNPKAVGSSPAPATRKSLDAQHQGFFYVLNRTG
jgi:hypothetical protein